MAYPLAKDAIFWTLQGEGHLRGFQMCFLRLAGCSVGCPQCDTDYGFDRKVHEVDIAAECDLNTPQSSRDRWVWITGGEPTDHDLRPLLEQLRKRRFSIAIASSGHRRVIPPVDWLSISPHNMHKWVQTYGNEVKLVEGLHGLNIDDALQFYPDDQTDFMYRYVQPLSVDGKESPESLARCLEFLKKHPNWALSRQDHRHWGVA